MKHKTKSEYKDYLQTCSLNECKQILNDINKDEFPDRYEIVLNVIESGHYDKLKDTREIQRNLNDTNRLNQMFTSIHTMFMIAVSILCIVFGAISLVGVKENSDCEECKCERILAAPIGFEFVKSERHRRYSIFSGNNNDTILYIYLNSLEMRISSNENGYKKVSSEFNNGKVDSVNILTCKSIFNDSRMVDVSVYKNGKWNEVRNLSNHKYLELKYAYLFMLIGIIGLAIKLIPFVVKILKK